MHTLNMIVLYVGRIRKFLNEISESEVLQTKKFHYKLLHIAMDPR